MKKLMIMVAVSVMILGAAAYSANGQDFITVNYIEVSGKANMEVAPDRISMTISINEKDYKNTTLSSLEGKMISQLQSMGIDTGKDLVVKDMTSNFKHYFLSKSDVKLAKQYQLTVHSAKQAGEVIIALGQTGISEINIDKVECSKIEQYKDEVRVMAVKNAKARAELLAEAIGHSVGKALHISESEHNFRTYGAPDMMMIKGNVAEAQIFRVPEIEFEKIKIETSVHVKFQLK